MTYGIAILVLFGAGLVCDVNAVTFESVERFWTECEDNSVLYTRSASEPSQNLEIKKTIDADHPLLLTVELTNKGTGSVEYSDTDLNMCTKYSEPFKHAVVRMFNKCFFGGRKTTCPVYAQNRDIQRSQWDLRTDTNLSPGDYEVKYTVKSDTGEVVFSTLKFRFRVPGSYDSSGWGWGK